MSEDSECTNVIDERVRQVIDTGDVASLRAALLAEATARRRAECLANIETEMTKYTLDLLVRVPDLDAFFRALLKTLAEEGESHAAGVWLINEENQCCDFWMAHLFGEVFDAVTLGPTYFPRLAMAQFLFDNKDGWEQTQEYRCDDTRLPALVRDFNGAQSLSSTLAAPLILGGRNLGWITLCVADQPEGGSWWRIALVESVARHAALALHKSRLFEQKRAEERRKAILEERNRLARDIHDNLAQGFGAILMQLQAAQRDTSPLPPVVAHSIRRRTGPDAHGGGAAIGGRAAAQRQRRRGHRQGDQAGGRARPEVVGRADRRAARRAAPVRRRRRTRGDQHRAGGADQRGPAFARQADHGPGLHRQVDRAADFDCRRWARDSARALVERFRDDQHAGTRRSHRRLAHHRHGSARRHRSGAGVGALTTPDTDPCP
jgi:hypothetical protein